MLPVATTHVNIKKKKKKVIFLLLGSLHKLVEGTDSVMFKFGCGLNAT